MLVTFSVTKNLAFFWCFVTLFDNVITVLMTAKTVFADKDYNFISIKIGQSKNRFENLLE